MKTWIVGTNGNRASVEFWGSEDAATKSLETLRGCSGCSDCSDCSGCSGCSDCSGCFGCSGCSGCYSCYGCSGCSDCSRCTGCTDCSDCYRCTDCSGCTDMAPQKIDPQLIPAIPNIHKAVYEAVSKPDALDMSAWHKCETTHCRAGWVVQLAGKAGKDLEAKTSCIFAAMQIYKASGYKISPVRFYDNNDNAMADMKRLAESAT